MGCNVSKEATATVSPLHSPAAVKPVEPLKTLQEEKQQDAPVQSQQPIVVQTPSPAPSPSPSPSPAIQTSMPEPVLPEPNPADTPSSNKPHKHHHHKHKREPSTLSSSKQTSPALLAVQAPRASLSNSTPAHTRKLSSNGTHHRNRSQSITDNSRGPSFTSNDSGGDQGVTNQMRKKQSINEEAEKPAETAEHTTEKREKKHKHREDKEKEPKERKKKEKLIKTMELADLQHLSSTNLEALWKQYDKDKNGTLDRKELKRLAKDCIGRTIAMCENEIRLQQPKLSDAELKAAVEKELKFVLPGAAKENGKKEDVQKEMVRRLIRKLDVNGDGDVTKAELLATWNVFAKELFQMKTAEGPVGCSIM